MVSVTYMLLYELLEDINVFVSRANVQTVRSLFSVENGHRLGDDQ